MQQDTSDINIGRNASSTPRAITKKATSFFIPSDVTPRRETPLDSNLNLVDSSLVHAGLLTDLAVTNKTLVAAGLPALPVPDSPGALLSTSHITQMLASIREIASSAAKIKLSAKNSTGNLRRQLQTARSQNNLLEKDRKESGDKEREIKELTRKLAVTEISLKDSQTRIKNLEHEIWSVRKMFGANTESANNGQSLPRNVRRFSSLSNIKNIARKPSARCIGDPIAIAAESVEPPKESLEPIAESAPQKVKVVDQELEEAVIARKAAEIARRHAATFSHDSVSFHTARIAAGKATVLAEAFVNSSASKGNVIEKKHTGFVEEAKPMDGAGTREVEE